MQAQSVGRDGICGMAGIVDVAAQRGDQSQPCWIDWQRQLLDLLGVPANAYTSGSLS